MKTFNLSKTAVVIEETTKGSIVYQIKIGEAYSEMTKLNAFEIYCDVDAINRIENKLNKLNIKVLSRRFNNTGELDKDYLICQNIGLK